MLVTLTNVFEVKVVFTTLYIPVAGLAFLLSLPLTSQQSFVEGKTCLYILCTYISMTVC